MTGSNITARRRRLLSALAGIVLAAVAAEGVRALPAPPGTGVPGEATSVLEALAQAIASGDHRTVADLVHPDGIRVGLGPDPERIGELTPGQAHYYFKALFQSRRTLGFDYSRQHAADGQRVLVRAVWRHQAVDQDGATIQRLLVTVVLHEGAWRLTELTSLRGG